MTDTKDKSSLKSKALKGTFWSTIERFSVQGLSFIVMIIMARILTPEDYGIVGMITVFMAVSQALVDSGFSQALIRKQDRSEIDNSTVFWFNIGISIILYFILFFCAPLIARFYNEPLLIPVTRLISLCIVINSLMMVQRALLTVNIDFKTQAKASLCGAILGGGLGIGLAYGGFGVWSIVWYQIAVITVEMLILWVVAKWRPAFLFSLSSFKNLFSFGSKLALSGVLEILYQNSYLLVIGKVYKADDLGFYTRANQFAAFPSSNLTGIIQRVTYPVLCSIQDNQPRLKEVYAKFLRLSAFIIFPLMIGLAVLSKPLILFFLGEKWEYASLLLSILCFGMMWFPVHAINLNLLQVTGRSDLFLKLEIIKKIVGVAILCATIPFGLIWMCVGLVINSLIALIINTHYTGVLMDIGLFRQLRDLLPCLFYSLIMGAIVYFVNSFIEPDWIKLIAGITVGVIIYSLLSILTRTPEIQFIRELKNRNSLSIS